MTVRTGRILLDGVARMRHEPAPWLYPVNHPAHHWREAYTLLIYFGGFKQRIYDWQGRPERVRL